MDKAILVNEQIEAGREFAEAFNSYQTGKRTGTSGRFTEAQAC